MELLRAIRAKCLDCCVGSAFEVTTQCVMDWETFLYLNRGPIGQNDGS